MALRTSRPPRSAAPADPPRQRRAPPAPACLPPPGHRRAWCARALRLRPSP